MTTEIEPHAPRELEPHAAPASFTREQVELIKRTVAQDTTDDELALFLEVAKRKRLDPFARQIHAVKRWDSRAQREVMQIQVGIDGYRAIAERTGRLEYVEGPEFTGDGQSWTPTWVADEPPAAARFRVKRTDRTRPVERTVLWREYAARKRDGDLTSMWANLGVTMLGKVAEVHALRAAFSDETSGFYAPEEMDQASVRPTEDGTTADAPELEVDHPEERRELLAVFRGWYAELDDDDRAEAWREIRPRLYGGPALADHFASTPLHVLAEIVEQYVGDDPDGGTPAEPDDDPDPSPGSRDVTPTDPSPGADSAHAPDGLPHEPEFHVTAEEEAAAQADGDDDEPEYGATCPSCGWQEWHPDPETAAAAEAEHTCPTPDPEDRLPCDGPDGHVGPIDRIGINRTRCRRCGAETGDSSGPEPDPTELDNAAAAEDARRLAEHYPKLTVVEVAELVDRGTVTIERAGDRLELTRPGGLAGVAKIHELETARAEADPDDKGRPRYRRTVKAKLEASGLVEALKLVQTPDTREDPTPPDAATASEGEDTGPDPSAPESATEDVPAGDPIRAAAPPGMPPAEVEERRALVRRFHELHRDVYALEPGPARDDALEQLRKVKVSRIGNDDRGALFVDLADVAAMVADAEEIQRAVRF